MSDSSKAQADYRWSTMSMGERSDELRRMLIEIQGRLEMLEEHANADIRRQSDAIRAGHRAEARADASSTVDGRCIISANEYDRLARVEKAARDLLSFDPNERPYGWNLCIDSLTEALKP